MSLNVSAVSVSFVKTYLRNGADKSSQRALADVDLSVREHEIVAVLGPSGGGKSTLLRVIAGLQEPDTGKVELDGVDVTKTPPHRRGVGLMFQDHALFPHKNVAGNVAFGAPRVDVDKLLELVGLAGAGNRRVETLSGGEQQRVALARALAPEPRLLMLDEPLGQLDRALRERLVVELRALFVRLGTTVLAVTHDQREAFALADRIVVMNAGRIAQVGTPREIWEHPVSEFVARFLGFTNIAPASVRDGVAETPWGKLKAPAGSGSRILIRPAGVLLTAEDHDVPRASAGPVTTAGPGTVSEVNVATFAGERVELVLSVPDAPPLVAHCPVSAAPSVGDRVVVRLDPDQAVLLSE